jgi:membrane protein
MKERLTHRTSAILDQMRRRYAVDVVLRAWADFSRDDGMVYAAAITYYVLLSLFPFLIFVVAIFGLLVRDERLQTRVVNEIIDQMPPGANLDEQIENVIAGVASANTGLLGLVGIAVSAWTASAVFGALRRALNRAFDVPSARPFIHGRVRDLISVVTVIGLVVLSVVLTAVLRFLRSLSTDLPAGVVVNLGWWVVSLVLPLVVSFVVFMLVFRLIPNHTLGVRDLWIGALLAAIGFEIVKNVFGIYLANFGRYDEVYGTLGGAMAFMFFVFIVSNLVILTAEIGSELAKDRSTGRVR